MTSIQFPTDTEAIEYAESNGISLSRIHFKDDNWYISSISCHPKSRKSVPKRKSSIASKLGDYTGVGFVVRTDWREPQYDTGIRDHPKSLSYLML